MFVEDGGRSEHDVVRRQPSCSQFSSGDFLRRTHSAGLLRKPKKESEAFATILSCFTTSTHARLLEVSHGNAGFSASCCCMAISISISEIGNGQNRTVVSECSIQQVIGNGAGPHQLLGLTVQGLNLKCRVTKLRKQLSGVCRHQFSEVTIKQLLAFEDIHNILAPDTRRSSSSSSPRLIETCLGGWGGTAS